MKGMRGQGCLGVLVAVLLSGTAWWGEAEGAGLLTPKDGSLPALAISDHRVEVVVEGGYAATTVEQVFHNPHGQDLEATYSFPVPEKGAVSEFTYWIDNQPVSGEVLPIQEAEKVYQEEKGAGREAGMAKQDSYRTFDMSVWPVRAGGDVRIRMRYLQPAMVDAGVGRFVYPLEEGGVDEAKMAFWSHADQVTGHFSFTLTLRSGFAVDALRLPSHPQAQVVQNPDGVWQVHLDNGAGAVEEGGSATPGQGFRLNQDIVLYWRLAKDAPAGVEMITYKPEADKPGTFMMTFTPGMDLPPIRRGRDWVFVLDRSGSMQHKFQTLVSGMEEGLQKLTPDDRVRVVLFNDRAEELTPGFVTATPAELQKIMGQLRGVDPDRGTNLHAGLSLGLEGLDADRTGVMILVTDGVANVGETNKRAFVKMMRKQDLRLFTAIIGNSANRPLLEAISKVSGGTAVNVSNNDDVMGIAINAMGKVNHETLRDVRLTIDGVAVEGGKERRFDPLHFGSQLTVFGKYHKGGTAHVLLTGKIAGEDKRYESTFDFPRQSDRFPEVERLWAYDAIEGMRDEMALMEEDGSERKDAITDLAVTYGLVTPETGMVVMREEIFAQRGIARHNRDRLHREEKARKQPAPATLRVDDQSPMFSAPAARHGAGATDGWLLLVIACASLVTMARRRQG